MNVRGYFKGLFWRSNLMKRDNFFRKFLASAFALSAISVSSVSAENIGMCTHMAHPHTGNTIPGVLQAIDDIGSKYIRDELRWGWGMQASTGAELQMPTAYWIDDAEKTGVKSLVILGLGNTVFGTDETEIPTLENEEYFNKYLDYVRFVVRNCKGKVEAYEIWNEPNHAPFNYQIKNNLSYEPSDYVELVAAVSEIIEYEDSDAKIVAGAHLLGGTKDSNWMESLFQAGIGNYIDAFSIHVYTHGKAPEDEMADECYDRVEKIMDDYGFNGEIWVTETGYSTATSDNNSTEAEQASYAIRTKVLWDNYLKQNGREGEFFWYDLRCGGTDAADREDNFGVIDYQYNPKPAFNSIKLYNELLEDRAFESLESSGYSSLSIKNQAKYKDEVTGDYTYILYKGKYASGNKLVPLSGDVAYLYDYQGNAKKYDNTNQSITVTLTEEPQIVHCVSYKSSIDSLEYDNEKNICIVAGKTNIPNDEITITLEEEGQTIQIETAKVKDGEFKGRFSPVKDGTFTLTAGKEEIETYYAECEFSAKRSGVAKAENIEYGISAAFNENTTEVTLSGKLTDSDGETADGILNALVLKAGKDLTSATIADVVYMDDVMTENGEFELTFSVKDSKSQKYNLYLRATDSEKTDTSFGNSQDGKYAYTFDFSKDSENLQVKASVNTKEAEEAVIIIISQYDNNGRMLETKTQSISANTDEVLISAAKNPNASSYRAFMWDSLTGMRPIIPVTEIK